MVPRRDVDRSHVTTAGPPQWGQVPQSLSSLIAARSVRTSTPAATAASGIAGCVGNGPFPGLSRRVAPRRPADARAGFRTGASRMPMFRGCEEPPNSDQAFWSKPADAEAGWMDDLSSEPRTDAGRDAARSTTSPRAAHRRPTACSTSCATSSPPPARRRRLDGGDDTDDADDALAARGDRRRSTSTR